MKRYKLLGALLFLATMFSPMASFALVTKIGEVDIFGIPGMLRYTWIMWLFIPIGILSIIVGLKLKRLNAKYKKNIVIACIIIPLLVIFGSYSFLFGDAVSYDSGRISDVEAKIGLDLPNNVKIASEVSEDETISYIKITDPKEKKEFEKEIKNNNLWKSPMSNRITSLLPYTMDLEVADFECYVFYNSITGEYNTYPPEGEYKCTFIAYHYEMGRLIIIEDFNVNIT